jgi:hypothetical protein
MILVVFQKLYNKKFAAVPYYFLLLAIPVITLFSLVPKIAVRIQPQIRQQQLAAFITKLKTENAIDARGFWQFREFYAPGSFTYPAQTADLAAGLILKNAPRCTFKTPILYYYSANMVSQESIVSEHDWQQYLAVRLNPSDRVILKNETTLFYQETNGTYHLVFAKPGSEMMRTNGFYSYTEPETAQMRHSYWISESVFN